MHLEQSVIIGPEGLHARPASALVKLAKTFASGIELEYQGRSANARSAIALLSLGLKDGDVISLKVTGEDAATAVAEVAALLEGRDDAALPAPPPPAAASGIAASEGVALGPIFVFEQPELPLAALAIAETERKVEVERFRDGLHVALARMQARQEMLRADDPARAILTALTEVASDPHWASEIEALIERDGQDAVSAVMKGGQNAAAAIAALADPYARARSDDILAAARAIACAILGKEQASLHDVPHGCVVVADDISALDLIGVDMARIAGIICRHGAATSHAAIVARSYGIPAIFGYGARPERVGIAALDGTSGEVVFNPDPVTVARFTAAIAAQQQAASELERFRELAPKTRSGRTITVAANLGSLREAERALAAGAMGVGLFRTEFLFMGRKDIPGEAEQAAIYHELAVTFLPHPVIIRTLDIGGDKPLPGIEFPKEDNPFLGWRGVRMCLDRPDIFKPQLRALLRAAVAGNIHVMVPMIADIAEVQTVKALIDQCRKELEAEGVAHGHFGFGIMVETPAAALCAEALAPHVDFFSIGTNDLTQYVMAADRLNPHVAKLYHTDHPAVLKAIRLVCDAAKAHGIWVGICGEAAAKPELLRQFLAMGVSELSMSPASILKIKSLIEQQE